MLRTIALVLIATCFACNAFAADETHRGKCTIVNAKDQLVVIGIYRPSEAGIEERLVAVPAKTQVEGIPVTLSDDEQFIIAYKAVDDGNGIKRANPIKIYDCKRISFIAKKRDAGTPDVLVEYHGFNESFPRLREGTRSLYIPDTESEAKRVLRDSNRKSTIVEACSQSLSTLNKTNTRQNHVLQRICRAYPAY